MKRISPHHLLGLGATILALAGCGGTHAYNCEAGYSIVQNADGTFVCAQNTSGTRSSDP